MFRWEPKQVATTTGLRAGLSHRGVAPDTSPTVKIRRHPRYRLLVASVARDSSRIDLTNGGPTGFHLGVGLDCVETHTALRRESNSYA